jgi:ribosomal protein S18 acetylase RimI-like enzyme
MNEADLVVRAIADGDVPAVIALWKAAGVWRPWNDAERDIAFARRGPHATLLVAEGGGTIAATAMVGEDGHRGWVYYVATSPATRGHGLGRTMMEAAEAWLKARGIWKINLLVRGDNIAARGFYERLGYQQSDVVCLQKALE